MSVIASAETTVNKLHTRLLSISKTLGVVLTIGQGSGMMVREVLFSHWELVSPLADSSSFGLFLVAFGATLLTFLLSVLGCLSARCFSQMLAAVSSEQKSRRTRGELARDRRRRIARRTKK